MCFLGLSRRIWLWLSSLSAWLPTCICQSGGSSAALACQRAGVSQGRLVPAGTCAVPCCSSLHLPSSRLGRAGAEQSWVLEWGCAWGSCLQINLLWLELITVLGQSTVPKCRRNCCMCSLAQFPLGKVQLPTITMDTLCPALCQMLVVLHLCNSCTTCPA